MQCEKGTSELKTKDDGKIVGKGADVRPCAARDMKSVKLPMRLRVPQPPRESEKRPLVSVSFRVNGQ